MIKVPSSQEDKTLCLIDILKTIPSWTLQYANSLYIHTDGTVNFAQVLSFIQWKALYILDESIFTKQHKRHILFERRDTELHIELF